MLHTLSELKKEMSIMTDEEKQVETETTDSAEEVEETNTDVEEPEQGDSDIEKSEKSDDIDYKAQLEAERAKREKAEKALAEKRFKSKRNEYTEDEEDDEPQEDIKTILRQEREAIRKEARQYEAARIAENLTTSPEEKELVLLKWQSLSHDESASLAEQVEDALAIVNKKRLIGERNEALRALSGKGSANRDNSGSRSGESRGKEPTLEAGDKLILEQANMKYNPSTKRYEKKLGSGKVQYFDTKEKRLKVA